MLRLLTTALIVSALGAPVARAQERVAEPADGCGPARPGCYLARDGSWREVDADYDAQRTQPADHWQTAAEMALFIGGGAIWYWLDIERNVADWDYDSWKQRMSWDAFAYDNNSFPINFIWHPMSGAGFHLAARANGQSAAGASAYGFLTSFAWEFFLEFKERISINDLVVTTGAGIPIGEFVYKLALDVQDEGDIARWTAGLPVALHDAIDGREPRHVDFWRDVRLSYGIATSTVDGESGPVLHSLTLDGRIVSLPGYLRPGRFARFFTDADVASLRTRFTASAEGTGLDLLADVTLLGLHRQSLAAGPGGLYGDAVTLGTSLAYLYRDEEYGAWHDELSITGLPGAALDTHVFAGPLELHLRGRLHGAFAGVYAAGFDLWEHAHPDQRPKSILLKQGYYYGWGLWSRLEAELRLGALELSASVAYGAFDSHEGFDRTQDAVTADVDAQDTALDWRLLLRWDPIWRGVFVEVGASGQRRASELTTTLIERELVRADASVGISL